ncbi:MAG: acyl carrier protein [Bacteroidetes bacterium GWE2_39_28]|nr:MAG: acyl carrier protein [Bacteroidetes bacterium GWE2_39_28]OFY13067.1 MAG: acyl carrier protein [Bacteroidetes bacterium GWF2_39_10]OFZ09133.1 MAG: acyl carrier protein [Bacteroidetes bacterium RIFOXYB2_FULL_39_7]OFZ12127.1 MAG: acyl carrier protein [Bacteroidetes bacterium RIFOXYC2_FULL_39_11]HCT94566.1 acyl carrier protein [Rikenellaceae bacterium]
MDLNEFVKAFAAEFEITPAESFTPETVYKELDEWDSLIVLSIIALVDDEFNVKISGQDLRDCRTIEDIFNLISKK